MARRASLPGADELFRSTGSGGRSAADRTDFQDTADLRAAAADVAGPTQRHEVRPVDELQRDHGRNGAQEEARPTRPAARSSGVRRVTRGRQTPGAAILPSGRERHEEKITVYVSPQELLDLERARWVLRAEHGLASDRGRIVREAVAVVLADFEAKGADSILVTRLQES